MKFKSVGRFAALFVVIAMAAATLSATPAAGDDETIPVELTIEEIIERDMHYWQGFRDRFQMNSNPDRIARIARSDHGQATIIEYSAPLTARELRKLEARYLHEDEADAVADQLETKQGFAGLYMNQSGGGIVHINFDRRLSRAEKQEIRSQFTRSNKVRFHVVAYDLDELEAVSDLLMETMAGGELVRVGVDVQRNIVIAGIDPNIERARPAAAPEARGAAPAAVLEEDMPVIFEEAIAAEPTSNPCASRLRCTAGMQYRAGVLVSTGQFCTTGFVMRRWNSAQGRSQTGILTAGHCVDTLPPEIANVGHVATINGCIPGTNTLFDRSRSDAVLIGAPISADAHIYKSVVNQSARVASVKRSGLSQGNTVCVATWRLGDGMKCGEILDTRVNINQAGFFLRQMLHIELPGVPGAYPGTANNKCSGVGGSSGAPVFNNRKAIGIVASCEGVKVTTVAGRSFSDIEFYVSKIKSIEVEMSDDDGNWRVLTQ